MPDLPRINDDNARAVPYVTASPILRASLFSFQTAEIAPTTGTPIPLLAVKTGGATTYEVPLRLDDVINARVADSSFDDFVLTIDLRMPSGSLYGRVTRQGQAVPDGSVLYVARDGSSKGASTDRDGYYAIYDALPDQQMELIAKDSQCSIREVTTAPAMRAVRLDFKLVEPDFPRTYRGTATRTVFAEWDFLGGGSMQSTQSLDMEITLWDSGHVAEAMIGASDGVFFGGTATTQAIEYTCPANAPKNAGELVSLLSLSFGPDWPGEFTDRGTLTLDNRYPPASDLLIVGSFSGSTLSGSGSWPDPSRYPRGARFTIPASDPTIGCTSTEETLYYRIELEISGAFQITGSGK